MIQTLREAFLSRKHETANREISLDVIRGVAILLAMGWHFNVGTRYTVVNGLLFPGIHFGWAGVDLFFVLSGFLVGRIIINEINRDRSFEYKRFFIRRAFRLWPVLYLYLAAQLITGHFPWRNFLVQVVLHVQNFFRTDIHHLWSLAVEEHFYLVLGVMASVPAFIKLSPSKKLAIMITILPACFFARVVAVMWHVDPISIQWQTQYRLDAPAIGVVLAILSIHYPRWFDGFQRFRWLLGLAMLAGLLALTEIRDRPVAIAIFGYPIAYLSSAAFLIIMRPYRFEGRGRWLARLLAMFGAYSYTLYIWHIGVGGIVAGQVRHRLGIDDAAALILVKYVAALAAAVVLTRLVERPMLYLRNVLFPSTTARTVREKRTDEQETAPRAAI